MESKLNFQIIGLAGAGKTTFLRMVGHEIIKKYKKKLPVLLALSFIKPQESIIGLIQKNLCANGGKYSRPALEEMLNNGNIIILFDGIDEAKSRVFDISEKILIFMKKFPSTQCLFSSRPWAAIPNQPHFITAFLQPFNKEQTNQFFRQWFLENPEFANDIIQHLREHDELYEVISTPLVATIFAVVKNHGSSLPTSLLDIYRERFRLLLHDWDSVKGVKRDSFIVADKYFFLRKLAFQLHKKNCRGIKWDELVKLAQLLIGEINNSSDAEKFIIELVQNNNVLFENDSSGYWGFGHLQYQEYLAALEAKENPKINLVAYLEDGWWSQVIKIYAEIKRDVSDMIHYIYNNNLDLQQKGQLLKILTELINIAPNTERSAKELISRDIEILNHFNKVHDTVFLGHGERGTKRDRQIM